MMSMFSRLNTNHKENNFNYSAVTLSKNNNKNIDLSSCIPSRKRRSKQQQKQQQQQPLISSSHSDVNLEDVKCHKKNMFTRLIKSKINFARSLSIDSRSNQKSKTSSSNNHHEELNKHIDKILDLFSRPVLTQINEIVNSPNVDALKYILPYLLTENNESQTFEQKLSNIKLQQSEMYKINLPLKQPSNELSIFNAMGDGLHANCRNDFNNQSSHLSKTQLSVTHENASSSLNEVNNSIKANALQNMNVKLKNTLSTDSLNDNSNSYSNSQPNSVHYNDIKKANKTNKKFEIKYSNTSEDNNEIKHSMTKSVYLQVVDNLYKNESRMQQDKEDTIANTHHVHFENCLNYTCDSSNEFDELLENSLNRKQSNGSIVKELKSFFNSNGKNLEDFSLKPAEAYRNEFQKGNQNNKKISYGVNHDFENQKFSFNREEFELKPFKSISKDAKLETNFNNNLSTHVITQGFESKNAGNTTNRSNSETSEYFNSSQRPNSQNQLLVNYLKNKASKNQLSIDHNTLSHKFDCLKIKDLNSVPFCLNNNNFENDSANSSDTFHSAQTYYEKISSTVSPSSLVHDEKVEKPTHAKLNNMTQRNNLKVEKPKYEETLKKHNTKAFQSFSQNINEIENDNNNNLKRDHDNVFDTYKDRTECNSFIIHTTSAFQPNVNKHVNTENRHPSDHVVRNNNDNIASNMRKIKPLNNSKIEKIDTNKKFLEIDTMSSNEEKTKKTLNEEGEIDTSVFNKTSDANDNDNSNKTCSSISSYNNKHLNKSITDKIQNEKAKNLKLRKNSIIDVDEVPARELKIKDSLEVIKSINNENRKKFYFKGNNCEAIRMENSNNIFIPIASSVTTVSSEASVFKSENKNLIQNNSFTQKIYNIENNQFIMDKQQSEPNATVIYEDNVDEDTQKNINFDFLMSNSDVSNEIRNDTITLSDKTLNVDKHELFKINDETLKNSDNEADTDNNEKTKLNPNELCVDQKMDLYETNSQVEFNNENMSHLFDKDANHQELDNINDEFERVNNQYKLDALNNNRPLEIEFMSKTELLQEKCILENMLFQLEWNFGLTKHLYKNYNFISLKKRYELVRTLLEGLKCESCGFKCYIYEEDSSFS